MALILSSSSDFVSALLIAVRDLRFMLVETERANAMIDPARGRGLFVAAVFLVVAIGCAAIRAIGARDDQPLTELLDDPLYAGRRLSEWIKLLESEDALERLGAARSLGDMGADAKGAIPWLIKSLSDRDATVRTEAAWTLGAIGPEAASAIPAMVSCFKRSNGFNKGIIGPAIGRIGARAVPALMELSNESNEYRAIGGNASDWYRRASAGARPRRV